MIFDSRGFVNCFGTDLELKDIPTNRSRKTKKRKNSFGLYFRRVLQDLHPEYSISSKSIAILDDFIMDIFLRLVREASGLTTRSKRKTLKERDIEASVKLVLVGELQKHALSEAKKAMGLYKSLNQVQSTSMPSIISIKSSFNN